MVITLNIHLVFGLTKITNETNVELRGRLTETVVSFGFMTVNKNPDVKQHDSITKFTVSGVINTANEPYRFK